MSQLSHLPRLTLLLLILNGFLLACYLVGVRTNTAEAVVAASSEEPLP